MTTYVVMHFEDHFTTLRAYGHFHSMNGMQISMQISHCELPLQNISKKCTIMGKY